MTCERHEINASINANRSDHDPSCYLCRMEQNLQTVWRDIVGRDPRYRYFEHRQWMYCWTTEKMGDGKYAAFIYKPIGKGSQSGNARRWEMVKEIHFTKRSTAKARALKWFQTAKKRAVA